MPKSRPIIFNSESVRAILEDRKSQSRRTRGLDQLNDPASREWWHLLRTEGDTWTFTHPSLDYDHAVIKCPYGIPGDTLWLKETWATLSHFDDVLPSKLPDFAEIIFKATDEENMMRGKWRSPIYLPKKFSRITPEIKDVRVERVQDISEEDAIAEGMKPTYEQKYGLPSYFFANGTRKSVFAKPAFEYSWDSINKKRGFGWDIDPFVFVLKFERSEKEHGKTFKI